MFEFLWVNLTRGLERHAMWKIGGGGWSLYVVLRDATNSNNFLHNFGIDEKSDWFLSHIHRAAFIYLRLYLNEIIARQCCINIVTIYFGKHLNFSLKYVIFNKQLNRNLQQLSNLFPFIGQILSVVVPWVSWIVNSLEELRHPWWDNVSWPLYVKEALSVCSDVTSLCQCTYRTCFLAAYDHACGRIRSQYARSLRVHSH